MKKTSLLAYGDGNYGFVTVDDERPDVNMSTADPLFQEMSEDERRRFIDKANGVSGISLRDPIFAGMDDDARKKFVEAVKSDDIDEPSRIDMLDDLVDYIEEHGRIWVDGIMAVVTHTELKDNASMCKIYGRAGFRVRAGSKCIVGTINVDRDFDGFVISSKVQNCGMYDFTMILRARK